MSGEPAFRRAHDCDLAAHLAHRQCGRMDWLSPADLDRGWSRHGSAHDARGIDPCHGFPHVAFNHDFHVAHWTGRLKLDGDWRTISRLIHMLNFHGYHRYPTAPAGERAGRAEPLEEAQVAVPAPVKELSPPQSERTASSPSAVPDGDKTAQGILAAAVHDVGQKKWTAFSAVVQNGVYGCAASVSAVCAEAGVKGVASASVTQMAAQLRAQGWQRVELADRRPGDVVIGLEAGGGPGKGGDAAHTGIVGETPSVVYDNDYRNGLWSKHAFNDVFTGARWRGGDVYVLRAPAA